MKLKFIIAAVAVVAALFFFGAISPKKVELWKCKWRQKQAASTLNEIATRVETAVEKGRPASSFGDLAWYPKDNGYEYTISLGFNGHFDIEARARNNNGDVWHIDEGHSLRNSVDGCYAGD